MTSPRGSLQRFSIVDDEDGSELGRFAELDGFFVGNRSAYADFEEWDGESINRLNFEVIGLILNHPLFRGAESGSHRKRKIGNVMIRVLGSDGDGIGEYFVGSAEIGGFSATEGGAVRAAITGTVDKVPSVGAGGVWDIWRQHPPEFKNAWSDLPVGEREGWLEVVRMYHPNTSTRVSDNPATGAFVLDGRYVEDLASFYLAVGEAVNGAGGYFGSTLMALEDCLMGGYGASAPFTLVWERFEVAQRFLAGRFVETGDGRASYLDIIMEIFSGARVEVVRS
ncbi:hypothetical protein [Streptomyces sp. NPDC008092]|uniref:barstar family protein n=1 Tax=Streptomyces sp. NPDC008092 TaxID=3364808 RepID=UPI0036E5E59F